MPAPKIIGIGPTIITPPKFVEVLENMFAITTRIAPMNVRLKPNRNSLKKNPLESAATLRALLLHGIIEKQESNH